MNQKDTPIVSICCLTYNHEPFIRDAIEGFLIQKTTFPIEILVHDDASSDGTTGIIREYENKYPNLIFPIYQKENQYSKGIKISPTFVWPKVQGKYIAICEGDDYWTYPYKLQKQVDSLEANSRYGLVHSDCNILNHEHNSIIQQYHKQKNRIINTDNLFEELLYDNFIDTCTVCLRKDLLLEYLSSKYADMKFGMGDYPLWLYLSLNTQFGYINEPLAVRRILPESASQSKNYQKKLAFVQSIYDIKFYFIEQFGCSEKLRSLIIRQYHKALLYYSSLLRDAQTAENSYKIISEHSSIVERIRLIVRLVGAKNVLLNRILLWLEQLRKKQH